MTHSGFLRFVISISSVALITALSSTAQSQTPPTPSSQTAQKDIEKYFTDVVLVSQDGQKMRLFSDLMKDKVVIIHSFFSTCTSACPVVNSRLQKIQEALGDRLGKSVHILSISVDPTVDVPERLRAHAMQLHARPGWYFLTGEKENVEFALRKLGFYVANKEEHMTVMIVGNVHTGLWKKILGVAEASEILKVIESVVNDKGQ
jgi:protein SCO1/2